MNHNYYCHIQTEELFNVIQLYMLQLHDLSCSWYRSIQTLTLALTRTLTLSLNITVILLTLLNPSNPVTLTITVR